MRFVVKFVSIAAVAFFFASCHNDVPELPTTNEVDGYSYCQYKDKAGVPQCKSTYEIPKDYCTVVSGKIVAKCE